MTEYISKPCKPIELFCSEKMRALREYMDTRFESNQEALIQRTKVIDTRLDGLNGEQSRLERDRGSFLRSSEYRIEYKTLQDKIEDCKLIIDRNSDRLTKIENIYLKEKDADDKINNLKELHEKDLEPIKKSISEFYRLVWIGVGIAIASQVILHYYFLK